MRKTIRCLTPWAFRVQRTACSSRAASDGMVTFAQAIREGKMAIHTDDFQKLTGQEPITVLYMFQHADEFQVGDRHSEDA